MRPRWILAAATAIGLSLVPLSGAIPAGAAATPSVTSVPVQVVQTSDGAVSYRNDGSGPSLVLIMGLSGSQDTWPPDLVNALATRHRVITFDNAGIGQTAMPPGTLTITAMADQTAAFITALHLHHPAVLGWSMGGMIAQALAVRHRGDVGRLVLSATFSGNGKATLPTAASASALANAGGTDNGNATMALLFPPDQLATQGPAFIKALTAYPNLYLPSATVDKAQLAAVTSWAIGSDRAGHGRIVARTLIGDGADDVLTPPANAQKMARAIPGARVVIYPDAGHGFLIQDATAWAAEVNKFLG